MKQCPNGHEVGDNVKFCPECGAEIIDNCAKFCAKCGNERKGTEKFCSQCGTPYGQSPTSNAAETKVSQGKSSKKGIIIAAVVAVIALTGGAAWFFLGNPQDKYSLEGLAKVVVNYDMVSDFHEGLAMVTKGDKYGFIDKVGNEVIPCIYEFMEEADPNFHDGLALVHQGEKQFFINKEGKEAFPYNYDTGLNFSEGLALVWKDRKCGYIDTKGNEVIALTDKYYGSSFHDGLAAVRNDEGKYGFIDKKGELVIPMSFDTDEGGEASEFYEGYAVVCKNEKYGYIDKSGKEVIPCNYSAAFNFSEGMAVVMKEGKFGFIDANGKEIIPCEYSYANHFSEGIAVVQKDGKYQFIDKTGKVVLDNSYSGISNFQEGFSVVYKEGEKNEYFTQYVHGFIDKNGKEVIPCIYNTCNQFSEGLAVVEKDGIYGFVDKKGNSTFDIQNEEVKKIIQAKIKEREETRKEEERRAEEERKRIEENKGGIELYKIASESSQKMVAYSCELDYNPKSSNREVVTYALYLYPRDESSGEAHFAQFRAKVNFNYENKYTWVEDRYYQYLAGENDYCVARYEYKKGELYIYAYNVKAYLTNETLRLDFEVASDGNSLRQIDKGLHFRRGFETSAPNDPFKK